MYGDTHVPDAHPALNDSATWDHIREIADSRSDAHSQRAMNGSDYRLTGLIKRRLPDRLGTGRESAPGAPD